MIPTNTMNLKEYYSTVGNLGYVGTRIEQQENEIRKIGEHVDCLKKGNLKMTCKKLQIAGVL